MISGICPNCFQGMDKEEWEEKFYCSNCESDWDEIEIDIDE